MSTSSRVGDPAQISPDLASALAKMSQVLLAVQSGDAVVELVTKLAVETLPGTIGAGVSLIDAHGKHTRAASNPLVGQADRLQYQYDSGPCLSAWRQQTPVRSDDLFTEDRWPEWAAGASALGIRSMLSVPLLSSGQTMGAIKVYSDEPATYSEGSVRVLSLFAEQASVLLSNMQVVADAKTLTDQLTAALRERDTIGQAVGILVAQGAADVPTASRMLRSAARRAGTSLPTFAGGLLEATMARPDRQSS